MTTQPTGQIPKPVFILQNSKPVTNLLYSSGHENLLYAGNREGDLTVYDLELRRTVFTSNSDHQPVQGLLELDDHNLLAFSRSGAIFKWNLDSPNSLTQTCVYNQPVCSFSSFALSLDKKVLYVPGKESGSLNWIDVSNNQLIKTFRPETTENRGMLMCIQVIDDSQLLLGFENGELVVVDSRAFTQLSSFNFFNGQPVLAFDYSKSKNFGICGSTETVLNQFTINQENSLECGRQIRMVNPGVNCVRIRTQDQKIFACGGWDSRVRVYGVKKTNLLASLDFHKESINCIEFSRSNLMAVGSNDGIISFWNLYN